MTARFLTLTLFAVVLARASAFACEPSPPPEDPPEPPPLTLDDLLAEYRALGLPLPPTSAKLVRYTCSPGEGFGDDGEPSRPDEYLGFLVRPGTKWARPEFLPRPDQPFEWSFPAGFTPAVREVPPDADALKGLQFTGDDAIILAVQCHARGWNELAEALFTDAGGNSTRAVRPDGMARYAWAHRLRPLLDPTEDRAAAGRELRRLLRKRPPEKPEDRAEVEDLLRSLDLTLMRGRGKPGSVEALIDQLVDLTYPPTPMWYDVGACRRLLERGFDAVPALIAHLDDPRLTRAWEGGAGFLPIRIVRVGDVARHLLEALAGDPFRWEPPEGGPPEEERAALKAAARKWWATARAAGEERYLFDRVLPPKSDAPGRLEASAPLLRAIAAKYPRRLPALYRTTLRERPDVDAGHIAAALARCAAVPAAERVGLLAEVARRTDREGEAALWELQDLDRSSYDAILRAAIDAVATDAPTVYGRECPGRAEAVSAAFTDSPEVWAALEHAARRATVALRMELIAAVSDPYEPEGPATPRQVRFLLAFLGDAAVRDRTADSSRFDPDSAGWTHEQIAVRDYAALRLLNRLGPRVNEKKPRTADEWAALRAAARAAAEKALAAGK